MSGCVAMHGELIEGREAGARELVMLCCEIPPMSFHFLLRLECLCPSVLPL